MTDTTLITLTTDFGSQDGYVGAMKGVIVSIHSAARIIDITHDIERQDVLGAAFTVRNACRSFPEGTIHVAVVDPGVGGSRRPILMQTDKYFFVGPDNGLFSFVSGGEESVRAVALTEKRYFLNPVSDTFHGRDIFAPVAAYLALGIDPGEFGPDIAEYVTLPFPQPRISKDGIEGEIVRIDRFGNVMTNIDRYVFEQRAADRGFVITAGPVTIEKISHSYGEVGGQSPQAIFGSSGFLEISVNRGHAQKKFGLKRGDVIQVDSV